MFQELTIKLGFLEDLDFSDKDIMKRIDSLASLLNVLANAVWDPVYTQVHKYYKKLLSSIHG